MKLIMTKGLPASGKTTWAKEYQKENPNTVRINKDDLRSMLHNGIWSNGREKTIIDVRNMMVSYFLENGHDVIVDDTNFNLKHESKLKSLADTYKSEFLIREFTDVPLEECIKRDLQRPNSVGEKVIKKMYNDYLRPKTEKVPYIVGLPNVIVCDIDGTLALFGNNNPYERDFLQDELNIPVANVLIANQRTFNQMIILVSGRSGKFIESTQEWLKRKQVPYDRLYMRSENDKRKDVEVKKEIYETHIKGKFNVIYVLDDRDQVVELWRSLGLTCLQVNYGDF